MRFLVGSSSAVLGMLAGWFGLALAIIAVSGPDRDGGIAMGAFFGIGPIGAVVGFVAGLVIFRRFGHVRSAPNGAAHDGAAEPPPPELSRPYAAIVLTIAAGLVGWAWIELL